MGPRDSLNPDSAVFVRTKLRELLNRYDRPVGFLTAPVDVWDQAVWECADALGVSLKTEGDL